MSSDVRVGTLTQVPSTLWADAIFRVEFMVDRMALRIEGKKPLIRWWRTVEPIHVTSGQAFASDDGETFYPDDPPTAPSQREDQDQIDPGPSDFPSVGVFV